MLLCLSHRARLNKNSRQVHQEIFTQTEELDVASAYINRCLTLWVSFERRVI